MAEKFKLSIISPDRVFTEGEAEFLEFTSTEGELGIYAQHIPLTTILEPCVMKIHNEGEVKKAAILRIVERNPQHLCQTLAHDMSGRAKLSLNGINGRSCHNMNPIPSRSPSRPIISGAGFVHKCAVFCFCIISHFCYHEKQAHALSQSGAYFPSICRIFRPPKPPKRRGVLLKNLNIFHENAEKIAIFCLSRCENID